MPRQCEVMKTVWHLSGGEPMRESELNIENINSLIRFWRQKKKEAVTAEQKIIARCYIDAYQTVRINHGYKLLPADKQ